MSDAAIDFWTDDTSVLFTSFWGWSPETWGTVGWTGGPGRARRNNLLSELTNPFITVCYVATTATNADPQLKGKLAGFYLVSHETGDRDLFTHPIQHDNHPDQWQHSLRALRAFSYLPEFRISVSELDSGLHSRARPISKWGEVLKDLGLIRRLREIPWIEVEIYRSGAITIDAAEIVSELGLVRAGPLNAGGYVVAPSTYGLDWQLYILRLSGNADAYLGKSAKGRSIYKIGLSVSPEMRRQAFEKAMPRGAFQWQVHRPNDRKTPSCYSFECAVAGEYAMKDYLADVAEHLGGEFYLATEEQIDKAWKYGHTASKAN